MLKAVADVNEPPAATRWSCSWATSAPKPPKPCIAKNFDGPVHVRGGRRGDDGDLINGRGDAYCGMLNCSYNLGMRHLNALHSRVSRRHRRGYRRHDRGIRPHRPRAHRRLRTSRSSPSGRVRRTSSPATRPSRACMSWAWKSRRTPSWTCWSPTRRTRATRASPPCVEDMADEMGEGKYYPGPARAHGAV